VNIPLTISIATTLLGAAAAQIQPPPAKSEYALDFNYGDPANKNEDWVPAIQIIEPPCRSEITGPITVKFKAPGMTAAKAMCWQQPGDNQDNPWGRDANLTPGGLKLEADGAGQFTFPADEFPRGPANIRIYAQNDAGQKDLFELQLYNRNGISWNQGIPNRRPPAAKDLPLAFSDDFDGPPSISNDGRNARYAAHKPRYGDFSGWPFTDVTSPDNPFSQADGYLKIAARKRPGTKGSTGLISSVNMDGAGLRFKAPVYMECRFTAQSAPGTWPAFWTLTHIDRDAAGDELDIAECYGGVGPKNPNHPGYSIHSHFWRQTDANGEKKKSIPKRIPIMELGGKSHWSATFHTYGVYIGKEDTAYYFDDIEVQRHPTNDISQEQPHLFLVNYAIGGISGWPIDLERYGNGSDMYIDYIRVYAAEKITRQFPPPPQETR
jgi:hypothetical protein